MDEITLKRIEQSHPKIRKQLLDQYKEANNLLGKNVRLRFAYVYRSIEEQNKLYNQKPKVTNAKGGQSIHNYGLAFDIVLLYDKDNNGTFESASWELNKDWKTVTDYFKSKGYSWGGDWTSFKDYPHFEVKGYKWQDLQNLPKKKDINGIEYPVL